MTGTIVSVVLVLLLIASTVYFTNILDEQSSSSNTTISNLQQQVSTLLGTNQALQAQLASFSSSNQSTSAADARAIYAYASQSVVTIQGDVSSTVNTFFGPQTAYSVVLGSGFVIDYSGMPYIITNYHVVDGMTNMSVTFSDGSAYQGTVVGTDKYSDLAVVRVNGPASELHPLQISDTTLQVGETAYAIGSPYGLSGSFASGIISQLGRSIEETTSSTYYIYNIIQFTVPINPGNSGGPLLDSSGMVLGITTATVSGSQGLDFAIPSGTILKELPSLVTTGTYDQHAYLGILATDMNLQLAKASGSNVTYGLLIQAVDGGGPASNAGLRAGTRSVVVDGQQYAVGGDIIVSIDGNKVVNQDAFTAYLEANTVAGQTVTLGVIRGGVLINVSLTLGTVPSALVAGAI